MSLGIPVISIFLFISLFLIAEHHKAWSNAISFYGGIQGIIIIHRADTLTCTQLHNAPCMCAQTQTHRHMHTHIKTNQFEIETDIGTEDDKEVAELN